MPSSSARNWLRNFRKGVALEGGRDVLERNPRTRERAPTCGKAELEVREEHWTKIRFYTLREYSGLAEAAV